MSSPESDVAKPSPNSQTVSIVFLPKDLPPPSSITLENGFHPKRNQAPLPRGGHAHPGWSHIKRWHSHQLCRHGRVVQIWSRSEADRIHQLRSEADWKVSRETNVGRAATSLRRPSVQHRELGLRLHGNTKAEL